MCWLNPTLYTFVWVHVIVLRVVGVKLTYHFTINVLVATEHVWLHVYIELLFGSDAYVQNRTLSWLYNAPTTTPVQLMPFSS